MFNRIKCMKDVNLGRKIRTMIRPVITLRRVRVLVDVDTQQDFFLANGAATVRNHRRVLANIRRIIAWARLKNLRMISTAQEYHPHDRVDYFLEGTEGQKKLRYTVRNKHKRFAADGCTATASRRSFCLRFRAWSARPGRNKSMFSCLRL